jgi:ABC-2 type transport system ATP-binding protein
MINIDGLTKHYGRHTVVDDLSFRCESGEVLGFLGPNGAGKSTTMKMLTGFVAPSAGSASVCGHDIATDGLAARRRIGYLPEGAPCYAEMKPRGFLEFIADIRGLTGSGRRARLDEVIQRLHLEPVLEQSFDTLSKGFKRRVGLAQAILHDPEVLILDEPTDGLDPNQKHEVRLMIREMSATKAIIFSTHILDEVDSVCSRAIIIADGKVVADDTPDGLRRRSISHGSVVLTVTGVATDGIQKRIAELDGVASVSVVDADGERTTLRIFPDDPAVPVADRVIASANQDGVRLTAIFVEQGRLDDVFRDITTDIRP